MGGFFPNHPQEDRRSNEDRTVCTYHDSNEEGERKTVNSIAPKEVENDDGHNRCAGRHNRTTQRFVYALVNHGLSQVWTLAFHFRIRSNTTIVSFKE